MTSLEPVKLVEDEGAGDRFLIYGTDNGAKVELRYDGDTLWMTQAQMAELFGVARQNINTHINNLYTDEELDKEATCKEIVQVRSEGGRDVSRKTLIHNIDVVIAVGYRVSSKQGTMFRRWATDKLVQFASKGFIVDAVRLKDPLGANRLAELRDIIRDIRADEANVYRELRAICAMCQDYDGSSPVWREFYTRTQAKLMWAVTSHTPSEIVHERADASLPNMGLQTWPHDNIRKTDAIVSKNYLGQREVAELNRLTTILLDIFEDQLDIGRLTTMTEAEGLLENQLANLNRLVLKGGGRISTENARSRAETEYAKFKEGQRQIRHAEADKIIAELRAADKSLPKPRKR